MTQGPTNMYYNNEIKNLSMQKKVYENNKLLKPFTMCVDNEALLKHTFS
jgi:hypothetical protein